VLQFPEAVLPVVVAVAAAATAPPRLKNARPDPLAHRDNPELLVKMVKLASPEKLEKPEWLASPRKERRSASSAPLVHQDLQDLTDRPAQLDLLDNPALQALAFQDRLESEVPARLREATESVARQLVTAQDQLAVQLVVEVQQLRLQPLP